MKKDFFHSLSFIFGCQIMVMLVLTPIPAYGRGFLNQFIDYLFTKPTAFVRDTFFQDEAIFDGFFTDSVNYFILLGFAMLIGFIVSFIVMRVFPKCKEVCLQFIRTFMVYYLAWLFLVYGFSKIFGVQFPVPHKGVLSMTFGEMDLDLLFWSVVGMSKTFTIAIGIAEIAISLLLLYKPTRNLGMFLFVMAMVQIVLINVGFDISVKVFSILLLVAALYLIGSQMIQVVRLLVTNKSTQIAKIDTLTMNSVYQRPLKLFVILSFVVSAVFPYL